MKQDKGLMTERFRSRDEGVSAAPIHVAPQHKEDKIVRPVEPVEPAKPKKISRIKRIKKKHEYSIGESVNEDPVGSDYEDALETTTLREEQKTRENDRIVAHVIRSLQIILIVVSVYVTYLIYGVAMTNYSYNVAGQIVPDVLTVTELQEMSEYSLLQSYYLRIQGLYEETLKLDYKLSQSQDKALLVAMEYQSLLTSVDKLITDLAAENISNKYSPLYLQMKTWVATDIAVYLQNISASITGNNEDKANKALIARNIVYDDFAQLSQNMMTIAQNTKGVYIGDSFTWSPDNFIKSLEGAA